MHASDSPFAEHTARLARELITALVSTRKDEKLAANVARIAEQLSAAAADPQAVSVDDPILTDFRGGPDRSPVSSVRNPIAPPVIIHRDDHGSEAKVTLGVQYEGPPGRVHGGIVALLFDHVLGNAANGHAYPPSFTRSLEVEYLDGTPLNEELTFVGRIESSEGRKRWLVGEVICDGTVRARARGLWITPRQLQEMWDAGVAVEPEHFVEASRPPKKDAPAEG